MKHLLFPFILAGLSAIVFSGVMQTGLAAENVPGPAYWQAMPPEVHSSFMEEKVVERPALIDIDPIITGSQG